MEEALHRVVAIVALMACQGVNAFAQNTVEGKLTGADGRPMASAEVILMRPNDTTCIRFVTAGKSGAYSIPIDSAGIWMLRYTGVAHREHAVAICLDGSEALKVNVKLGTYRYRSTFDNVSVLGDFNRWFVPTSVPMKKKGDGTYEAEVTATGPTVSYQLNNVAEGARMEGVPARRYRYRRYDGYAAVAEADNGRARIVFNPGMLPPPGKRFVVTFGRPASRAAKFAANYDKLQLMQESHQADQLEILKSRGKTSTNRDWAGILSQAQKRISAEKDGILREQLRLHYLILLGMAKSVDAAAYTSGIEGISPGSDVWLMSPHVISSALHRSTLTEEQKTDYILRVLNENRNERVKSALLFDEFMIAKLSDRKGPAKTYFDLLVNKYGSTPEGTMVREKYSP